MDEGIVFDLTPAELAAVEDHKYFMSMKRGREVPIAEAIGDFRSTQHEGWRRDKFRKDNVSQIVEIEKHQYIESEKAGHDIGREEAAMQWITLYARAWRVYRESLDGNGFSRIVLDVGRCVQPALSPIEQLREIARRHRVDLFLHKAGISPFSFTMSGRAYWHVRQMPESEWDPEPQLIPGDRLEVVAFGGKPAQAFEDILLLLAAHPVG